MSEIIKEKSICYLWSADLVVHEIQYQTYECFLVHESAGDSCLLQCSPAIDPYARSNITNTNYNVFSVLLIFVILSNGTWNSELPITRFRTLAHTFAILQADTSSG